MQAVVCGQGFSGPQVVTVPAGTKVCYPLAFRPSTQNIIMVTHRPLLLSLQHVTVTRPRCLFWSDCVFYCVCKTNTMLVSEANQAHRVCFLCFLWKRYAAGICRDEREAIIPAARPSRTCAQSSDGGWTIRSAPCIRFTSDWVNNKMRPPLSDSLKFCLGAC